MINDINFAHTHKSQIYHHEFIKFRSCPQWAESCPRWVRVYNNKIIKNTYDKCPYHKIYIILSTHTNIKSYIMNLLNFDLAHSGQNPAHAGQGL